MGGADWENRGGGVIGKVSLPRGGRLLIIIGFMRDAPTWYKFKMFKEKFREPV
jgi:hypothetical protein